MNQLSAYLRPLVLLLLLLSSCTLLYLGRSFLLPITYGAMFAFLLNPVLSKLVGIGLNKYIAAILSVSLILIAVLVLLSVFGWQIQQLIDQKEEIRKELVEKQTQFQDFTKKYFGISASRQEEYAQKMVDNLEKDAANYVGNTASVLTNFMLSLIYAILLLSERNRIKAFFMKIFASQKKAKDAIGSIGEVVQKYLNGKLLIIGILAVTYAIGFLIAGIQYAILIAVLAAFLSFIPYIGNLIGAGLATLLTMATGGGFTEILILLGVIGLAQVVESYILTPWIIGSNVDLNPLFSIVSVIGFGMLWGAAGAVIALPLVGMIKVLFEHLDDYQPLAFLMGESEVE